MLGPRCLNIVSNCIKGKSKPTAYCRDHKRAVRRCQTFVLSSFALAYGVLEKVTREAEKRSAHRDRDLVIGHKHDRARDP